MSNQSTWFLMKSLNICCNSSFLYNEGVDWLSGGQEFERGHLYLQTYQEEECSFRSGAIIYILIYELQNFIIFKFFSPYGLCKETPQET